MVKNHLKILTAGDKMRMTQQTREILNFIDTYDYITANICARIILKGQKQAYTSSCRKLRTMEQHDLIKKYIHPLTKEFIYQIKKKQVNDHHRYAIEFYSRIYEIADEVIYFTDKEKDVTWPLAKRRNDFHIIYIYNGNTYAMLGEVDLSHFTSKEKLVEIYEKGEVQEWYKEHYDVDNYFPSIAVLSLLGNTKYEDVPFDYLCVDFEFNQLESLIKGA